MGKRQSAWTAAPCQRRCNQLHLSCRCRFGDVSGSKYRACQMTDAMHGVSKTRSSDLPVGVIAGKLFQSSDAIYTQTKCTTHQLIQHLHCALSVLPGSLDLFHYLVSVAAAHVFPSRWPPQTDLCFCCHLYACMSTICADTPIVPC